MTRDEFNQNLVEVIKQVLANELPYQDNQPTEYLTRVEIAQRLRISLPTLGKYSKLGFIKAHKIGSRVLYRSDEVDQVLISKQPLKYRKS